jgi:hypothetical protein
MTSTPWRIRHEGKTFWTNSTRQCDIDPGPKIIDKIFAWWFSRRYPGWPFIKIRKPVK